MRFTGIARPEGGAVQTKGESFPAQLARPGKGRESRAGCWLSSLDQKGLARNGQPRGEI